MAVNFVFNMFCNLDSLLKILIAFFLLIVDYVFGFVFIVVDSNDLKEA